MCSRTATSSASCRPGAGRASATSCRPCSCPGVTLVISPLIALMKDQVDVLNQRGIPATLINSTLDPAEQRARISEVESGRFRLVYVAPERFRSPRFLASMARLKPSLLAVDEAHCISEWGHDFRPDYARLGLARRQLGSPTCIALTATATDAVRRDIADQLSLRDPELFITGFDRPNLHYAVTEAGRDEAKLQELARALDRNRGPAIIYTSSRARCESVAGVLEHRAQARDRRLSRRPDPRAAHPRAGTIHEGRGRDRRRDQRVRHGGRQGRHPLGDPLQSAGDPRGLLPGGRPRRARRPSRRFASCSTPPRTASSRSCSSRTSIRRGARSTRSTSSSAGSTTTRSR